MKKRMLVLLLALVMVLGLTGCGTEEQLEALTANRWVTVEYMDESTAGEFLASLDFYESERALADLSRVGVVKVMEFSPERTYRMYYDEAATRDLVRAYLKDFIHTLCENRAALAADYDEAYQVDMAAMSEEEFLLFYAELFGSADEEELTEYLTANFFNYEAFDGDLETGAFELTEERILCTETNAKEEEYLLYTLGEGTLTLTYADAVEEYTAG